MALQNCDVIGEIRYGSDLSFEDVGDVEATLRERVEELLSGLSPLYVDFRSSGDDLGFLSTLREFDAKELRGMCQELILVMDPGATGRLVAVSGGFGPVHVWSFSARGLDETCLSAEE
jgi:hypothetical protein